MKIQTPRIGIKHLPIQLIARQGILLIVKALAAISIAAFVLYN